MSDRPPPPTDTAPEAPHRLADAALATAAAAGRHALLRIDEVGVRAGIAVRRLLVLAAIAALSVIAAAIGYALLVQALAVWVAAHCAAPLHLVVYAAAAALPLLLLRSVARRYDRSALSAFTRRHAPPP